MNLIYKCPFIEFENHLVWAILSSTKVQKQTTWCHPFMDTFACKHLVQNSMNGRIIFTRTQWMGEYFFLSCPSCNRISVPCNIVSSFFIILFKLAIKSGTIAHFFSTLQCSTFSLVNTKCLYLCGVQLLRLHCKMCCRIGI